MRQGEWYTRASRGEDRGGSRQADGRVLEYPFDELVLTLPHPRALVLEHRVPRSPGQHQERDDAGQQKREPTTREQLRGIGGDENQLDNQENTVDRHDEERVIAPLQRDKSSEHSFYRHQHRD